MIADVVHDRYYIETVEVAFRVRKCLVKNKALNSKTCFIICTLLRLEYLESK